MSGVGPISVWTPPNFERILGIGRFYRPTMLASSGLLAYWRNGETSGTVGHDEMGAHNGIYVGSPMLGATGLLKGDVSTAVTFISQTQWMISSLVTTATDNWGISRWLVVPALGTYAFALINGTNNSGNSMGYMMYIDNAGHPVLSYPGLATYSSSTVLTPGTVVFLVATRSGTCNMYLNGVVDAGFTGDAVSPIAPANQTVIGTNATDGSGPVGTNTGQDTAIWGVAPSPTKIAELYAIGAGL